MPRKRLVHRAPHVAIALTLAVALSGCTGDDASPSPELRPATPTVTSTPVTESSRTSEPAESTTSAGCRPKRDATKPKISGEAQQIAVDSGPRDGATGNALLDPSGIPVAYVVASDDIPDFIADRFCVGLAYLNNINGPRRGGAMELYVGDTINLDAQTVTTVGDINGEVMNGGLPDPLPEQHQPTF